MNAHSNGQRLLALLLAIVLLLGMVPARLGVEAKGVTAAEKTEAESLLSQIEAIESGTRYSKYAVHKLPLSETNVANGKSFFEGLNGGKYIFVNKDPIDGKYYAFNPTNSNQYSRYVLDPVTVKDDQLYDVDPGAVIELTLDTAAKTGENKNDWIYQTDPISSARARFYFKTVDDRYINLTDGSLLTDTTDRANALHLTTAAKKVSTTIYVKPSNIGDGIYVHNSGEYKDKQRTGLQFDGSTLTARANYSGHAGTTSSVFYLYEAKTDRVNVEALYNALVEAKTYLRNPNPYESTYFAAFLTAVEYGILNYNNYNKNSLGTSAVSTGETLVTQATQTLKDAMTKVKPYNEQINELMIPATQQIASLSEIKEGSYYILGLDRNGFYRSFDPASNGVLTSTCKGFNTLIPMYFNGSQIERTDLAGSETLYSIPDSRYSIQLSDGQYLRLENNDQTGSNQEDVTSGKPMSMTFVERVTSIGTNEFTQREKAFLIKSTEDPQIYLCNSNNGNRFHSWRYESDATIKANDEYDKYLFRISDLTLELFKALEYVEPYAYGNGDGRYDETVYSDFVAKLKEALEEYRVNRATMDNATLQTKLDALAAELKDYARQLTLADSKASYIDIPVEILDFASDKLLFEYYPGSDGARFSMSAWATIRDPVINDTLLLPLVDKFISNVHKEAGTTTNKAMQGLVGDRLVNDKPVYEDYVIGFIAAAILTEWMADSSDSHRTLWADQVTAYEESLAGKQWQTAFWKKLSSLYSNYKNGTAAQKKAALGSLEATLQDTDTKANGGNLPWSEVDTAFDLAYYILNNLWQPATEALTDGRAYNTVVTERDTLRLYYDESTELYTIDASNRMVYDGYTIYNTVPQIPRNHNKYPLMTPIDGLGFEKNNVETDPGTYRAENEGWEPAYAGANMGYTLHASGSFIYYEDQEQYFDFVGDDDVYFFVNDRLVMDIGGAHSPAGFTLDLRKANEEKNLGLEDGGVYTFDMFYAERHTDGSNMKLSTNIKIVSADTMTSKGQYAVEVAGTSTVGSDGKGGEMIDNQLVNVGDVVAYSFDIDNYREVPVVNLEFHDPSLGVSMSKDNVSTYNVTLSSGNTSLSVTDPQKANGVATLFKELIIEYTPYDSDGNLTTGTIRELDPEEMIALIQSKVSVVGTDYQYAPLDPGIYRTRVKSADMLKKVLAAGIPMTCRFSIYGFCRKTISFDAPYTNELTTYCSYRRSSNVNAELATITGKASRILRVPAASEMPDIPRIEITLDYGKPVQIPLADITNQIYFEKDSPASVGEIVGYVKAGYNGQLLKKLPKDLLELSTGDTVDGLQGTFTLREASMEYAMEYFMEMVENLYAVVKLNDFNHAESGTQYEYALVELRLIPANMMYYETEDFTSSEIEYVQAGGSYTDWERKTDNIPTEENQDFDPVAQRTYDMLVDRDSIPAEAFFVDFDGKGYESRYRLRPQYKGNDFDDVSYWYQETYASGKKFSVDTTKGYAVLNAELEDSAADEHFFQSIEKPAKIENQSGNTTPLQLIPGKDHIVQLRFRVENCSPSAQKPLGVIVRLSDDSLTNVSNDEAVGGKFLIPLDADKVFSEEYLTVTYDLDNSSFYTAASYIDSFRIIFSGIANESAGRIYVDYIYMGPEQGLDQDVYGEYLYFTFDNTPADQLRYRSSIYGSTATAVRNYDTTAYWKSDTAGNTLKITSDGYLEFSDQNDVEWNIAEACSVLKEDPIRYKLSGSDIYRIRLKITGDNVTKHPDGTPTVALYFTNGEPAAYCHIDLADFADEEFHTLTIPMNTVQFQDETELKRVRINISFIENATFTVDYVYIGPASMVDKVTEKADYLFFDFTDNDAAKSRYSNPVYGGQGMNYDTGYWHVNHTYSQWPPTYNASAGTMAVKTVAAYYTENKNTIPLATAGGHNFSNGHPLSFEPSGKEYFKVRMKIEGATDTSADFCVTYADGPTSNNTNIASSFKCAIPAEAIRTGKYFTLEGYISFGDAKLITALRFDVYNITMSASNKPITVTYDYFYVGPAEKAKPVTDSLYFGFDAEAEDTLRYSGSVYGGYSYDDAYTYGAMGIGMWTTSDQTNGSHLDYTIDNRKGTLNLSVKNGYTEDEDGDRIYGPYILTTDFYGTYGMGTDFSSLRYRPENATVVQFRFRVSNCKVVDGANSRVVFLFGGYDAAGNFVAYGDLPTMYEYYTIEDGYVTVSIPTHQAFRNLETVTNLGLRFQNIYSDDGRGLIELDYFYVGPGEGAPYTYGYDSSYNSSNLYSDGISLFTEGNGIYLDAAAKPEKYTEASFTFKGTGFDLISRTDKYQATIRVAIYNEKGERVQATSVNLKGELELYQLPVYSIHDLDYGTYTVVILVNDAFTSAYDFLSRDNDFFFDAIRIYDPIDTSMGSNAPSGSDSAIAYAAYLADSEAHPMIQELRDILLSAENYNATDKIQDGAVFVDYSTVEKVIVYPDGEEGEGMDMTDPDLMDPNGASKVVQHLTSDIVTYKKIGPKNETYLGPQQLVAFRILVYANRVPNRLDIGAKAILGDSAELSADSTKLRVKIWDTKSRLERSYWTTIQGPSHQYYSIYLDSDVFRKTTDENRKSCYMTTVLIANPCIKTEGETANVLSVTDIRAGFRNTTIYTGPTGMRTTATDGGTETPDDEFVPIRFVVSGDMQADVDEALKDLHGVCGEDHIPGQWQTLCTPDVGQEGIEQLHCSRCGALLEEKRTDAVAELAFFGASVTLQSDLALNFKILESYFTEQGYTDPYMEIETQTERILLRNYRVQDGLYVFSHVKIAPHEMGDMVRATLYAKRNGKLYSTEVKEYSVATYCYSMLEKATGETYGALRTLLVDILHYGAMTQQYMGYRLDSLCNASLTEEQLAYGTQAYRQLNSLQDREYVKVQEPAVRWKGAGVNLRESVALRFKIEAESYEGLRAEIRMGDEVYSVDAKKFDYRTDGTYLHFRELTAVDMSEAVYVTVYRGEEQVSHTIRYSIESYAYAKEKDSAVPYLAQLVKAMIAYGDSAKAYVESTK